MAIASSIIQTLHHNEKKYPFILTTLLILLFTIFLLTNTFYFISPIITTPASQNDTVTTTTTTTNISSSVEDVKLLNWEVCRGPVAVDYIPCLDNFVAIKALSSRRHMEHRERHCPKPNPKCLVPLPVLYKVPLPWPKSRDMVNVIVTAFRRGIEHFIVSGITVLF